MAVNKVVLGENTLIDLTADTVSADKLSKGITAHDMSGEPIVGTMEAGGGSSYTFTNGLTENNKTVSWNLNDYIYKNNSQIVIKDALALDSRRAGQYPRASLSATIGGLAGGYLNDNGYFRASNGAIVWGEVNASGECCLAARDS